MNPASTAYSPKDLLPAPLLAALVRLGSTSLDGRRLRICRLRGRWILGGGWLLREPSILLEKDQGMGNGANGWVIGVIYRFNRRESEFTNLLAYNNYLEEVETLTFNLLYNIDVATTEAKLAAYAAQNAPTIAHNSALQTQEAASAEAKLAAQKEQARLRREEARKEENEERALREEGKKEVIDKMATSTEDPDKIARDGQKVVLKKSTARRTAAEKARQQQATKVDNGSSAPLFEIQGLKPVVQPEPEKAYDAFGGYAVKGSYYALQEQYEHPWLEKARTDEQITAGGYDVGEYCARAMLEAFAGLGCFIEDEVGGRDRGVGKEIATAAAAAASGDREVARGDVL